MYVTNMRDHFRMNHEKEYAQVTIAIPTRDHPQYFTHAFKYYLSQNIRCTFLILDSSRGEDTQKICLEYEKKGLHIQYMKVPEKLTPDEKERIALSSFQTRYLWICGDGIVIKKETFHNGWFCDKYHAIHFIDSQIYCHQKFFSENQYPSKSVYDNHESFAKNFFWTGTFMGALVIDRTLSEWIIAKQYNHASLNTGFYRIAAFIEAMGALSSKVLVLFTDYCYTNPSKRISTWMSSNEAFEIWTRRLPRAVESISNISYKTKEVLIKTTAYRNGFLTLRGLLRWRAMGILNRNTAKIYYQDIVRCSYIQGWELKLISLTPIVLCRMVRIPFSIRATVKNYVKNYNI